MTTVNADAIDLSQHTIILVSFDKVAMTVILKMDEYAEQSFAIPEEKILSRDTFIEYLKFLAGEFIAAQIADAKTITLKDTFEASISDLIGQPIG